MEPEWFQRKLRIIPVVLLHVPPENLVAIWNNELAKALDQIVPMQPLLSQGSQQERKTGEEISRAFLVLNKGQK